MSRNIPTAPALQTRLRQLGQQLTDIRLSRNLTQAHVAAEAGVSISSIKRLEAGGNASLDTFVRVLSALGLADHLAALLPDPTVRPIERVAHQGQERQRARGPSRTEPTTQWAWKDEEPPSDAPPDSEQDP